MSDSCQELGFSVTREKKVYPFHFIMVPLRNKVLKYGTPKPREDPKAVPSSGLQLAVRA